MERDNSSPIGGITGQEVKSLKHLAQSQGQAGFCLCSTRVIISAGEVIFVAVIFEFRMIWLSLFPKQGLITEGLNGLSRSQGHWTDYTVWGNSVQNEMQGSGSKNYQK